MNFNIEQFLKLIENVHKPDLFNPYTDKCETYDHSDNTSHIFRLMNLKAYLKLLNEGRFTSILVGEAPGHLGCRKTGLAFTDEKNLNLVSKILKIPLDYSTITMDTREPSANYVWGILKKVENPPFLWNIIPFHPFNFPNQLTNRTPNESDYQTSKEVIEYFFKNTTFERYFAVGKVAEKYLKKMGFNPQYIRHPSFGGSNKFIRAMEENFIIKKQENKLKQFI